MIETINARTNTAKNYPIAGFSGEYKMEIAQLVVRINERHQTQFVVQHRYATGENQGAYALTTPTGDAYVLKLADSYIAH
jgi:hypothetical protein